MDVEKEPPNDNTSTSVDIIDNVDDLGSLPEREREILKAHLYDPSSAETSASLTSIYAFASKTDIFLQILGLIAAVATGIGEPIISLVFRQATNDFNHYATNESSNQVLLHSARENSLHLVYIAIAVCFAAFIFMSTFSITSERIASRIRSAYLASLLHQNIAFYEKLGSGTVVDRIDTQTLLIQEGLGTKVPMIVNYASTMIASFVIAFILDWRLTLVVASILPFIALSGIFFTYATIKYEARTISATSTAASIAEEAFSSIRTVMAFNGQLRLAKMYQAYNEEATKWSKRLSIAMGGSLMTFWFSSLVAYALSFWFSSILVVRNESTVGNTFAVFFLVTMGSFVFAMTPPLIQVVSTGNAAAAKIIPTINRKPPIDSREKGEIPLSENVRGQIMFENIKFVYPSRPNFTVLPNFNLTIPSGSTTALVGASGSGKSTIVGMLLRFYEPLEGNIIIDGIDVKDLDLKWLRNKVGYVAQEPQLFSTTIRENVEYGLVGTNRETASASEKDVLIREACKLANADIFVEKLPKKYETQVGDRGFLLSGGQKQRIAIARAIIGDPKILLLDEATSALDTKSEILVQEALDRVSHGRTTIMIAHRLSTIKKANNIVVMSNGKILEQGSHNDLLDHKGLYHSLVEAQSFHAIGSEKESDISRIVEKGDLVTKEKVEKAKQADAIDIDTDEERKELQTRPTRSKSQQSKLSELSSAEKKPAHFESDAPVDQYGLWTIFKKFWKMNSKDWYIYIAAILAAMTVGLSYLVVGIVFGSGIEAFQVTGRELRNKADKIALYFVAVSIVGSFCFGLGNFAWSWTGANLVKTIKEKSFEAIVCTDIEFFDRSENSPGALTGILSDATAKIKGFAGSTTMAIVQNLFTVLGGIITAIAFEWKLALVATACIPIIISAGFTQLYVFEQRERKIKSIHGESSAIACEAASTIRTVAALTLEDHICKLYDQVLSKTIKVSRKSSFWGSFGYAIGLSLNFCVMALIFWYGTQLMVSGELNQREFYTILITTIFASMDVGFIFAYSSDMSKTRSASRQILTVLDREAKLDPLSTAGERIAKNIQGHIKFEDVSFSYPTRPGLKVLHSLNLDIKPGSYIALVGPSGCGKSSTIQLVERFYDVSAGSIKLDGTDIKRLNISDYRSKIGLVSQEPTLFSGTVKSNILFGAISNNDKDVSQTEIEEACKAANIHDFICTLPDGYESDIGGKGVSLSGGQKQRIAIARALLRKPKILLLDEATSALDSHSEKIVQETLDSVASGRTTIAVAHRLSTIQKADIIYVYDNGKIIEQGTHLTLLCRKGLYYELVKQQELEKST